MMNSGPVTDWRLEDNTLIVAFAMPLGLDAVVTGRSFLSAFDATLATRETTGFGPLTELWIAGRSVGHAFSHAGRDVTCNERQMALLSPLSLGVEGSSGRPGKRDTRMRRW
jgi:hypothetical protein